MNEIEEIKSRLNIVDVIGSYIKLEKAGINYRACCPFHSEKSPSFFVSPSRQIWHCFGGCGEGGDIFKFVMKIENLEFPDALRILASRAGVELKARSADWEKNKTERQLMLHLCELSTRFFEAYLEKSAKGKEAIEYLLKRGMKLETIKEWRLGYAPEAWAKLSELLIGKGYKREDIVKAGLAISKDGGKFFDRFRSRIMFPIEGFNSEVVGFTGRIFGKPDTEDAKYLNTPATLLYDKSRALFGIDKAKLEIRKHDFCILVEGNVDCIMSHQAGFKNCVAVSGTALTPYHLSIIKRYSPNLVLAFDMDAAGNKATEKGIVLAQKMEFNIKVIPMSAEKDPADIILLEGEEKWKQMIEGAKPINEFYFDLAFKDRDANSIEDRKKIMADLLPILKKINNAVEQSYWLQKLGNMILATEADLRTEMKKIKEESTDVYGVSQIETKKPKEEKKTKQELLEEQTILFALKDRAQAAIPEIEKINNFASPTKEILLKIKENPQITNEMLLESFKDDQAIVDYINYLILKSEISAEVEDLGSELEKCVTARDNLINKKARTELTLKIKACEAKGDFESLNVLLEEFNNLTKSKKQNEAQN
jgi:DNA primase